MDHIEFEERQFTMKLRNWFYVAIFTLLLGYIFYDICISDNYEFENHSEIPKDNY